MWMDVWASGEGLFRDDLACEHEIESETVLSCHLAEEVEEGGVEGLVAEVLPEDLEDVGLEDEGVVHRDQLHLLGVWGKGGKGGQWRRKGAADIPIDQLTSTHSTNNTIQP